MGQGCFLKWPEGLLKMSVNQAYQQSGYTYICSGVSVRVMRIKYATDTFHNKTTKKYDEKKGIEQAVNVKHSIPWEW